MKDNYERTPDGLIFWDDFSASDIPQDIQNELMALGDLNEEHSWGVARRVADMIDAARAEGYDIPRMKLYAAVGQYSRDASETVRMYYGVWKVIPPAILRDYSIDPAPGKDIGFHQFRYCKPHLAGKSEQEWRDKLEAWFAYCTEHQLSYRSTDGINGWLGGSAPSASVGRAKRTLLGAVKMRDDLNVPIALRNLVRRFVDRWNQECDTWGLSEWRVDE